MYSDQLTLTKVIAVILLIKANMLYSLVADNITSEDESAKKALVNSNHNFERSGL